jgi:hypothetical protein
MIKINIAAPPSWLAVITTLLLPGLNALFAQTSDVGATVQFSSGESVTVTDFSEPMGVAPGEVVHLTVNIPGTESGEDVSVRSLDGGRVISNDNAITDVGTFSFVFKATPNIGENRVELRYGMRRLRLQFWVLDTANPQNNPPVITPDHPQG